MSLGKHKVHATTKTSDISTVVQRPMNRPLYDTSASEITGAIRIVYKILIADATHALLVWLATVHRSGSRNLHQACCEQKPDEDLARKRDVQLPQGQGWENQYDYVGCQIECALPEDNVLDVVALSAWRELVPDHTPRRAVEHRPECEGCIKDQTDCDRGPRAVPHDFISTT
jgi:hypothetical protein